MRAGRFGRQPQECIAMSTTPDRTPPIPAIDSPSAAGAASPSEREEIKIVSHSGLFYWWPVWAVGFVLALLTYFDGHRVAIVPDGTQVMPQRKVEVNQEGGMAVRDVLVAPEGRHLPADPATGLPQAPTLHMAKSKNYGVLYAVVLILVIVITNVPLRGLWSVIVLVVIVLMSVIFALAGWWERILGALDKLQIYINAGGYLSISLLLFAIWLVTFVFFDRQLYMIFTPGQLRVCQEIGGGETAYDTMGMVIQKQRNDLFRHWILGLGSGDLIVNTSGAKGHHFDLPNVLFVGHKVRLIEDMLREKPVVRG
jgi:hypothetical protein